jgi:hypothetical protein
LNLCPLQRSDDLVGYFNIEILQSVLIVSAYVSRTPPVIRFKAIGDRGGCDGTLFVTIPFLDQLGIAFQQPPKASY